MKSEKDAFRAAIDEWQAEAEGVRDLVRPEFHRQGDERETPAISGGNSTVGWLDVICPACETRNRIGFRCPDGGKSCRSCGAAIDFWAAWNANLAAEDYEDRRREFWAAVL